MARAAGAGLLLDALDLVPGSPVPAVVESSHEALALVVAGAAKGHPIAPLSPRSRPGELRACLESMGQPVVLHEPRWSSLVATAVAGLSVRTEAVGELVLADGSELIARSNAVEARAPAFVLHTSGTTGRPKPVVYRQDRLAARTEVVAGLCGLRAGDGLASMSAIHHVAGLGNHAVALGSGAFVVPVPRFDLDAWHDLPALAVAHVVCVPTVLQMLLDAGALRYQGLRAIQYGGSPIHPRTLQTLLEELPGVDLINMFGQTEGSPITCLTAEDHRRIRSEGRYDLLRSVGRAAPGVELRIDNPDRDGHGEVLARADHLMAVADGDWLHAGDVGRIDADGYLHLAGRRSDMIIRGGENVHPLEVEQVLALHPDVADVAVMGLRHRVMGEEVVAVVVPAAATGGTVDWTRIRAWARERLAGFKVPTRWELASALPRNANGKVDRRALADEIGSGPPAVEAD